MPYRLPEVRKVTLQAEAPPEIPYGVQMIGAPLEWGETEGAGIKVAVIDSGDPMHPDIKTAGSVAFVEGGVADRLGHGTHVAGTIAASGRIKGVAPGAELYTLRACNNEGFLPESAIAEALRWCVRNHMDVVNMSFGGPDDPDVIAACRECYEAGIVLVASAGNDAEAGIECPGNVPTVIATAAVDIRKVRAPFSSVGPQVAIAAAGVQVWSTWLNGTYCELAGTSMASPHIAGAAALIQAKALKRFGRKLTPDQVRMVLQIYAEDLGWPGPDSEYGCGVFSFGRLGEPDRVKHVIRMTIDRNNYTVDGRQREMDVAPMIKAGRTFVPARFVAEAAGAKVTWDEASQMVTIEW